MNKDWKSEIGEFLGQNNFFRLKYLNEGLMSQCVEYAEYISEFYDIRAKVSKVPYKGEIYSGLVGIEFGILLSLGLRNNSADYKDFRIFCFFNADGHLILKAAIDYDLWGPIRPGNEKDDHCIYNEEELTEAEVIEKEYIFGLFNNRLIDFIKTVKAKLNS